MKRLLISIDKVDMLSATITEMLDVIDTFVEKGWAIDLSAGRINRNMQPCINNYQRNTDFRRLSQEDDTFHASYDLIWIYKGYLSSSLLNLLVHQRVQGPIVFRHFFNYADIYLPYGAELENRMAAKALSLSTGVNRKMVEQGIQAEKLTLLPYICRKNSPVDTKKTAALKQILYASATFAFEMQEVQQKLLDNGLTLEWLDLSNLQERITSEWLQNYDVVIGADEIVPKALCAGVPVFLAAEGRSEGYITEDNFERCDDYHFSCVSGGASPAACELVEQLTEGYEQAVSWVAGVQSRIQAKWDARTVLDSLLESDLQPQAFTLDEAEIRAFELHGKTLLSDMEQGYSINKWLTDRRISRARRETLTAFVESVPVSADIAVVIVDDGQSTSLATNTIMALMRQSLPAKSITLLTPAGVSTNPPEGIEVRPHSGNWVKILNEQLATTPHDAILTIPAGVEPQDDALLLFAEQRLRHPSVLIWYSDEMTLEEDGEHNLVLKPDCNIDLLRSIPYIGQVLLFNSQAARDCGGLDEQYQHLALIDLLWRFIERGGVPVVGHVSEVLYTQIQTLQQWFDNPQLQQEMATIVTGHLQRLGITATIEKGLINVAQRVRYHWDIQPLVSIIIPTRDHLPLLKRCIESLMEKTSWHQYEILIVDNQSVEPDACQFLDELEKLNLPQLRVLRYPHPFDYAAINNFAATQARGEVLLFLNNDIEVFESDWLSAMMEHVLRGEVGLVGARLEFDDGRVQGGGILTGIHMGSATVFEGATPTELGYLYYLQSAHNLASVSGACMMVRKAVFDDVGGFSADKFPIYLGDTDLGLKLQKQGYLNVWTPYARLKHMGGATRLLTDKFNVSPRPGLVDYDKLRETWGGALAHDPAYHPALHKMGTPFTLSPNTGRFFEPLPGRPLPVILANHVNWFGCGNHRVIQPFKALEEQLLCEGGLLHGVPGVMEVALQQPDIVLLELLTSPSVPYIMEQYRKVSDAKIVVEYDDYIPNLPIKNQNRHNFPQHIIKNLRRVIENADWIVVSTHPLAEAYRDFHPDIRVAQNRLSVSQWGHLWSERDTSKKIRVGWAGGNSHAGDLEILRPIIKELEDQVQWVFMGMKPEGVKCEFHPGVPFELYPEKLASLNLDLALVPLEINQFNECKSNLRLLEIGTCGVPIIATDIVPYRCDLPVTLVDNRFKDWMKAIQMHIHDAQFRVAQGDALRDAIQRDWYLRDHGLDEWHHSWLSTVK
ncbi:glycosyltransferase [Phytobacter sp. V91]|uniref:glycosyltransferase n=1 Tax=Phytobacter sp. V91 TaxID=3369425 RepID=UPI003F637034